MEELFHTYGDDDDGDDVNDTINSTKWCPAPDCNNAVEFELGCNIYDVTCLCSHAFCWKCTEEAHRPVDCSTAAKWISKNCAESENMNWILANSKSCPKCKRPIEKNQGCMHMSCTPPCKFEFCWLCLGAWSGHNERTGGFYACNCYEADKQEGLYDEAEKRKEMAKNSLERYTHYYEGWTFNQNSLTVIGKLLDYLQSWKKEDSHQTKTVHLEEVTDKLKKSESQLKLIMKAWQQILECRRVLKWTYAYGYYLPEHDAYKRKLLGYSQGEAEAALENLYQCAEKELLIFLGHADIQPESETFRLKLAELTRVTCSSFENLVIALEKGLPDDDSPDDDSQDDDSQDDDSQDDDSQEAFSMSISSKNAEAKGNGGKGTGLTSQPLRSCAKKCDVPKSQPLEL